LKRIQGILCLLFLVLLASCQGSGDLPLDQADPDAVPANPTFDQVNAIVQRACTPCHQGGGEADAPGVAGRIAAEDDVPIESCTDIVAQRESIWETAVDNTMPPGALPRLTSEEKLTIRRWIDNGAPAPCN
jgi:uncharacterized membrane protein